mgnify:CR=1 FL=1
MLFRSAFFGYLLVLGLGILAIGWFRQWVLLNYLGMLFAYVHVVRTLSAHFQPQHVVEVMTFLVLFFLLYTAVTIVHNVVRRRPATLIETLGLLANAAVFLGLSHFCITRSFAPKWVAVVSVAMSAGYVGLTAWLLRRGVKDRGLLLPVMGLAGICAAVTMPLLLSREWLTAMWAVQALVMLWLGNRLQASFLQIGRAHV